VSNRIGGAGGGNTKLQSGDSGFSTVGSNRCHFQLKKVADPAYGKRCRIL